MARESHMIEVITCARKFGKIGSNRRSDPKIDISVCSMFSRRGGTISWGFTGGRCYSEDLSQGELEVPCTLTQRGSHGDVNKVKVLLKVDQLIDHKSRWPWPSRTWEHAYRFLFRGFNFRGLPIMKLWKLDPSKISHHTVYRHFYTDRHVAKTWHTSQHAQKKAKNKTKHLTE